MSLQSTLSFGLYYQSAIMPPFTSVVPEGEVDGIQMADEDGNVLVTELGVPIVGEG
jgi:hypothetical protein